MILDAGDNRGILDKLIQIKTTRMTNTKSNIERKWMCEDVRVIQLKIKLNNRGERNNEN
jgi:hypothetical protein